MIRPFAALATDVMRRMTRGKAFWAVLAVSLLFSGIGSSLLGVMRDEDGPHATLFGDPMSFELGASHFPPLHEMTLSFLTTFCGKFLACWAGTLTGILLLADAVTSAFAPGAAELHLPKPLGRGTILVARHVGAVLVATFFASLVVGLGVLMIWLRTGDLVLVALVAVPVTVLNFAVLHAAGTVASTWSQNALVGGFASIATWGASFFTNTLGAIDEIQPHPAPIVVYAASAMRNAHRILPRISDVSDLLVRLATGTFGQRFPGAGGAQAGGWLYEAELVWNLAMWLVVSLLISTVIVRRRDF